ncbi:SWPV1-194 [Shearwaterpox virus]|uniref:SWPV1-194 n=1 Tax=Shearwaterpox virus TaxID=1974596 RepID=A0A1V0S818_CNPV|nr:SWPV1-194 [Shearwaterpox virus]
MYTYKILSVLYLIIYMNNSIIYGAHPNCNKKCCNEANNYEKKTQNRDLCRFKCFLSYVLTETEDDNKNTLSKCLGNKITTETLDECLKKCPALPPKGCKKECCDERDMILTRRRNDPDACCDGHTKVKKARKIKEDNVIDCRTSSDKCKDQGFLILYSDNSTVCLPRKATSNLGLDFPYSDECWQLDGHSTDRNKNYWNEKA